VYSVIAAVPPFNKGSGRFRRRFASSLGQGLGAELELVAGSRRPNSALLCCALKRLLRPQRQGTQGCSLKEAVLSGGERSTPKRSPDLVLSFNSYLQGYLADPIVEVEMDRL